MGWGHSHSHFGEMSCNGWFDQYKIVGTIFVPGNPK